MRDFVSNWRTDKNLQQEISYVQITGEQHDNFIASSWPVQTAIELIQLHLMITFSIFSFACAGTLQDLAKFYQKNGQRARLAADDGKRMLDRLQAAKSSLPSLPDPK